MKHWWILDVGDDWEDHFSGSNSDRCEAGMITHDLDFERVESSEAIEDYTGDDEDRYGSEASCEYSGYDDEKHFITTDASRRESTSIDISPSILVDEDFTTCGPSPCIKSR